MTDLDQILGDLFWGVQANTLRQQRAREIEEKRLEEFFRQPQMFRDIENPRIIPPEVKQSYQNIYGMPWPKSPTTVDMPIGFLGEGGGAAGFEMAAQPRSVEEMMLRQASQQGRAQGTMIGEREETLGKYGIGGPEEAMVNIPGYGKLPADVGYHYLTEEEKQKQRHTIKTPYGDVSEQYGYHYLPGLQKGAAGKSEQDKLIEDAQELVLKFANQSQNQWVQMMVAMSPETATKNQALQAMLRNEVPNELKPIFDQAIAILNKYYTTGAAGMGALPKQSQDPFEILK